MWYIVDQDKIKELNDAVNQQWYFIQHLKTLPRWNNKAAMHNDIVQLRENLELISELLNESIIWEEFA